MGKYYLLYLPRQVRKYDKGKYGGMGSTHPYKYDGVGNQDTWAEFLVM